MSIWSIFPWVRQRRSEMIRDKDNEYFEEVSVRLNERMEYLKRDMNLLLRNLSDIKDSVVQLTGEIEKVTKIKN